MDYLDKLLSEVLSIRETFGVEPERGIPTSVEVKDLPATIHTTSSFGIDGKLLLSSELLKYADFLIKKEAFSLFIPPEADSVPQVHDLAWAYSGAPEGVWKSLRIKAPRPFTNYDPILLFSLIPREAKLRVIGESLLYVKASTKRGEFTLEGYIYLLNKFLASELKLTEVDRKIIEVLSSNPYANVKLIKRETGVSEASISRSIRKLKTAGCIFGPENVKLWKLGLITILASYPNKRNFRDAFWKFPYTYTQLIPVSGGERVHAYLVTPGSSIVGLERLKKFGIEIGIIKRTVQRFNFNHPSDPMDAMVRAYLRSRTSEEVRSTQPSRPPVKLTRKDIAVLNQVMREGRVSSALLSRAGIKSAKQRLGKLRSSGIIGNYYVVGLPLGYEITLFRLACPHSEAERLASTLASVTTAVVHYVEGKSRYCLALAFSQKELKSDLLRGIRVIYGDEVEQAGEVMNLQSLWLIPEELWDESKQAFSWEEPLEELMCRLEGS